jgi:hypothetical protein
MRAAGLVGPLPSGIQSPRSGPRHSPASLSPWPSAATSGSYNGPGEAMLRNPITGIAFCCAAGRERSGDGGARTEDQEFAPVHSITSSWAIRRTNLPRCPRTCQGQAPKSAQCRLSWRRLMTASKRRASQAGQNGNDGKPPV